MTYYKQDSQPTTNKHIKAILHVQSRYTLHSPPPRLKRTFLHPASASPLELPLPLLSFDQSSSPIHASSERIFPPIFLPCAPVAPWRSMSHHSQRLASLPPTTVETPFPRFPPTSIASSPHYTLLPRFSRPSTVTMSSWRKLPPRTRDSRGKEKRRNMPPTGVLPREIAFPLEWR